MTYPVGHRAVRLGLTAIAASLLAVLAGCGGSAEPLLPVEGQVKFGGKALAKGTVVLYPDASKGNASKHEPRGAIADGRYKVATHPSEGAPAGWYKVAVIATAPTDAKNPYSVPRSLIPQKFAKADESRLALEVRRDASTGAYDLDLK